MAFVKETSRTPNVIADISVELFDPAPGSVEIGAVTYSVQIIFSDGSVQVRSGNLIPHLSQAQINSLLAFMATIRLKATAEFLP